MSAKYDLIGKYWDMQKTENNREWKTIDYSEAYTDYTTQLSLFDINKVKKRIIASKVLNVNNDKDFYDISRKVKECSSIALLLDNEKDLVSPMVKDFYYKRLSDVAQKLENENPGVEIIFMKERA